MKCNYCGANIDIETDVCPFCGMSKTQFDKHRKDMQKFKTEYKNVENTVVEKNRRTTEKTVRVAIVIVLCFLIVLFMILPAFSFSIEKMILKSKIQKNRDVHLAMLAKYEEEENYVAFYEYYTHSDLYYVSSDKDFADYKLLENLCNSYYYCVSDINAIMYYHDFATTYTDVPKKIEQFVDCYDELQKAYNSRVLLKQYEYLYNEECYSDTHMETYKNMMTNIDEYIIKYLNIGEDNFEEFVNSSKARQILMIEEAMQIE